MAPKKRAAEVVVKTEAPPGCKASKVVRSVDRTTQNAIQYRLRKKSTPAFIKQAWAEVAKYNKKNTKAEREPFA